MSMETMPNARLRPSTLVLWFYLSILALAPIPLGSHRPGSAAVAAVLLGLCAMAWGVVTLRHGVKSGVSWRRLAVPALLFALALAWGAYQLLPQAPAEWVHPIWRQAEVALPGQPERISMAPARGYEILLQFLANGLAFLIAVQLGRSDERAGRLVEVLALVSGVIALYGLTVHAIGSETILWMDKWAYRGDLTAVLVNRNHYADLAGLGLLCAVAATIRQWQNLGWRQYARDMLSGRSRKLPAFLIAACACAAAIPLTHSRAGTAATLLGLLALLGLSWRWDWRKLLLSLLAVAVLSLPALALMEERLAALDADTAQRATVWRLSLEMVQSRPWLGQGLGAFPDAFQAVRPETVSQLWTEAHNSWLETVVELGIPAAFSLFVALWWVWGRCVAGALSRRRNRVYPALGTAAGLLVGSHALVDFSIQIPAVAFFVAALMGVGFAQSWSSRLGPLVR